MATIDVAVPTDLAPQQAWKLASDLHRFDEWLTIFGGWRSEVPDDRGRDLRVVVHQGQGVPQHHPLAGDPLRRAQADRDERCGPGRSSHLADHRGAGQPPGSKFQVLAELKGGLLSTRIGQLVARVLQSEVRKSVTNLAALR